jgi:hypothetical protein
LGGHLNFAFFAYFGFFLIFAMFWASPFSRSTAQACGSMAIVFFMLRRLII